VARKRLIEQRLAEKEALVMELRRKIKERQDELEKFDNVWVAFEFEYVKVRHEILNKVFSSVDKLVVVEMMLSQSEERGDIEGKQRMEGELVGYAEALCNELFPDTKAEMLPEDVIPLAEACIFYESKCTEEWLHLCRHLIKDYLELRVFISKVPEVRLFPELGKNADLCRLLKNFHTAVLSAREALAFVATLPALIHAKTSDWMTKQLLAPDLQYIQNSAAIGRNP